MLPMTTMPPTTANTTRSVPISKGRVRDFRADVEPAGVNVEPVGVKARAKDDRLTQGGPGRTLRRGTWRSSRTFPQRGHRDRQGLRRAARVCSGPLAAARDPSPEPAPVWGDESISLAPGMPARPAPHARHVASRWRSGSHIGCRARRVAGSSYLHLQHASPPRVDAQRRGRCRTPLDGLDTVYAHHNDTALPTELRFPGRNRCVEAQGDRA